MSDDIEALCERLERGFEDAGEFTVIVDKADLRAAIAELRRLSALLLLRALLRESVA